MVNKKLDFEIDGVLYNYKLFDTLKAINETKSQRKAAKQLNISHTVLNKRILKAENLLSHKLVTVSNKGSSLTDYGLKILDEYITYENRLNDNNESIIVAGGPVSCEFIRQLASAYQVENLKILETDNETAMHLADVELVDILCFDDPVKAYLYNLEPIALGRDYLLLLSHEKQSFNTLSDLDGLNFVEVEGSAQRLAWNTLANYDLDFDIVRVVDSFHEAIRLVEQNKNLYTFINKSMAYTSLHTSDVLKDETYHIFSALIVKNDSYVESFLNFASHRAQKVTVSYGFEPL